ncbi:hypothetical protein LOTGIDRAFT_173146 [Lottia gigantea]|uniref:Stabilizer of axonemal microtubules 2 n=1 Tax=Lottia gigantea TaxID=225164 RepID=V4B2A8_LOTGI|nr:hypothetical protein LOTGIDRAFT_173146 [Lottia gigantea]ESP00417.1 hypothetical protein LOTGIDRAFT_173146 [Lottia gigantea]
MAWPCLLPDHFEFGVVTLIVISPQLCMCGSLITGQFVAISKSYKPWPIKTRKSARPAQKSVALSTSKTYNKTCEKQPTQKQRKNCSVKSCKPVQKFSEPSATFGGSSIYKTSYPPYDPELAQKSRSKAVKPSGNLYTPILGEGDVVYSTFKEDFKPYPAITPPKPIIPRGSNIKIDGVFNDCTIYTETYVPYKVEPIEVAKAPRRTKSQTNVPFIAITTHMADYVNHGTVGRDPCFRPSENSSMKSDSKFQGESTHAAAYKAWPVQERFIPTWGREKEYKKIPGKLMSSSTYAADFQNPGVPQKAKACRPPVNKDVIMRQNGRSNYPMQSTYDASFQAWEGARPAEICRKQDNVYRSPTDKMNTSSTHQSHYKGEQTKREPLCRRTSQHRELDSERKKATFNTTYREAFRGHHYI